MCIETANKRGKKHKLELLFNLIIDFVLQNKGFSKINLYKYMVSLLVTDLVQWWGSHRFFFVVDTSFVKGVRRKVTADCKKNPFRKKRAIGDRRNSVYA